MTSATAMPTTTTTTTTIGKKRSLPVSDSPAPVSMSTAGLTTAGHDDDAEEILVEEEPLPHEIATDPATRCRYPSKRCLRARTVKKTGALHGMCAFHRAKANRNQRRLEKRKRLRAASGESCNVGATRRWQSSSMGQIKQEVLQSSMTMGLDSLSAELKFKELLHCPMSSLHQSPRQVGANLVDLEPFRAPAPLFLEDLEELCELVDVKVKQECVDSNGGDLLECALQLFA